MYNAIILQRYTLRNTLDIRHRMCFEIFLKRIPAIKTAVYTTIYVIFTTKGIYYSRRSRIEGLFLLRSLFYNPNSVKQNSNIEFSVLGLPIIFYCQKHTIQVTFQLKFCTVNVEICFILELCEWLFSEFLAGKFNCLFISRQACVRVTCEWLNDYVTHLAGSSC